MALLDQHRPSTSKDFQVELMFDENDPEAEEKERNFELEERERLISSRVPLGEDLRSTYVAFDNSCLPHIHLRFLCPEDITSVKTLCSSMFPIDYPHYWYEDVTSNPNLFSMAATFQGEIVGLIVAEVKRLNQCSVEDRGILSKSFPANTPVAYVLTLGVLRPFRKQGVASLLFHHLLSYLTNGCGTRLGVVKAVYLHVLCTNDEAIRFYERRKFRRHRFLSNYYSINGELKDGFSYVLYINGGEAPWAFNGCWDIVSCVLLKPCCVLPRFLWRFCCRFTVGIWRIFGVCDDATRCISSYDSASSVTMQLTSASSSSSANHWFR